MNVRVLLVDDVVEVRRLVRMALRLRGGFDVVGEAADGAEAVRLAGELRPDVVVLDLGLPDLAGREVLTRICLYSPESKVVVFSGMDSEDREWLARRVKGYVLKDAELDYLLDLLESVVAPHETEALFEVPRDVASVREAREFVAGKLTEWGLDHLIDDALLVTSELVTNAITHAESACHLRLSVVRSTLRIDVIDTGRGAPEPQPESATEEHGRGLHLVDALATAWGLDIVPGEGKLVWAELADPVESVARR